MAEVIVFTFRTRFNLLFFRLKSKKKKYSERVKTGFPGNIKLQK